MTLDIGIIAQESSEKNIKFVFEESPYPINFLKDSLTYYCPDIGGGFQVHIYVEKTGQFPFSIGYCWLTIDYSANRAPLSVFSQGNSANKVNGAVFVTLTPTNWPVSDSGPLNTAI